MHATLPQHLREEAKGCKHADERSTGGAHTPGDARGAIAAVQLARQGFAKERSLWNIVPTLHVARNAVWPAECADEGVAERRA